MNAKEYLRQVAKLNNMLRNKTAELEMWRSVAVGISGSCDGERVQSSGNPQKMADAVIKCVETEQQISDYIHRKSQIIKDLELAPGGRVRLAAQEIYPVLYAGRDCRRQRKIVFLGYKCPWHRPETSSGDSGRERKKRQCIKIDG